MKNSTLFLRLLIFSICITLSSCEENDETKNQVRCGFDEYIQQQLNSIPEHQNNINRVEELIKDYIATIPQGEEGLRGGRVIIPVVVHVLHNGEAIGAGANISDAQIQSQINVMNRDFRRMNADVSGVPTEFTSLTADTRIEFQLARRDPDCNATNGITRQRAGRTSFSYTSDDAKRTSTGGRDSWDTDKYLNIWVVSNLSPEDGIDPIGYSSFPNAPEFVDAGLGVDDELQGFVCEATTFGNIGSVSSTSAFNDGRTAVHEFGHFFGLWHIWRRAGCGNSDEVDDTPNQDSSYPVDSDISTSGIQCPENPSSSCSSSDMWMNYMDYVGDPCMIMFSQGQSDRMIASLYTTRTSLIGSDGLLPPPDGGAGSDLFIQDTPEDIGNEPNNESDIFYVSEDIWIRNSSGTTNQEHETPRHSSGGSVFVYVRVRNNGCAPSSDENIRLYWAKASSGLSWTSPWDGSVSIDGAVMGGEIGLKPTGVIPGGGFSILEYEWTIPNPDDYSSFGADKTHFCLLARIESTMTSPETTNLWNNVKNNNNIAWKNITIMEAESGGRVSVIMVGNYESKREYNTYLQFQDVDETELSLFDYGEVFIELHPKLMTRWVQNGEQGSGVKRVSDNEIKIERSGATIKGILLNPKEIYACKIKCKEGQPRIGPNVYFMDLIQFEEGAASDKEIGGQRFLIKAWNR